MRSFLTVLLLAASPLFASDQQSIIAPKGPPVSTEKQRLCTNETDHDQAGCTDADGKRAALREFRAALKLLSQARTREALEHLELAAKLSPDNVQYQTAATSARQRLVQETLRSGNRASVSGKPVEALGNYQEALELDPQNEFALRRLKDSLPALAVPADTSEVQSNTIEIKPSPTFHTFHFTGSSRDVITQVCQSYGISAVFDESVRSRPIRLDLDNATWATAMKGVSRLTRTFWTAFSDHEVLFSADSEANRRLLERSVQRTFYFGDSSTPQNLTDIVSALRAIFEVRTITPDSGANSITVRTDPETMAAISRLMQGLKERTQQVMLDVSIFEVSSSFTRSFGISVPTQFQIFYIPNAAAATVIAQTVQQGSMALSNLGIGTKQLALAIPSVSFGASQSQSNLRTIDEITIRATQGEPSVLKIGERYPILTSSYSSVVANQAFQLPLPAFTYVDIGLTLKATPMVQRDGNVGIQLQLQLSALGADSINGNPVILNSEYNGYVSAKDGEPIVAAGNLMKSTTNTRSGWAGVELIPGLGSLFSSPSRQVNDDDLLIVIVPHILTSTGGSGKPDSFVFRSAR